MDDENKISDFGRGLVVCLAKFSAHLESHWYERVRASERWRTATDSERSRILGESKTHPHGDSARMVSFVIIYLDLPDAGVGHSITSWMNAASDHFYDLDMDRAPEPLKELAELTLKIGHGFSGETYTWETVKTIFDLWKKSCMAVDAMMGVKADFGRW